MTCLTFHVCRFYQDGAMSPLANTMTTSHFKLHVMQNSSLNEIHKLKQMKEKHTFLTAEGVSQLEMPLLWSQELQSIALRALSLSYTQFRLGSHFVLI